MSWGDEHAADESLRVEVVRGNPTDEELAALIAVVSEVYAREEASATASDAPSRTAWELSARNLREPLRRDLGWGRFG
ncbi:acyl-CoA carboxylase subunit epsilon [Microbacterium luticocti]|uniref:acyl-CoA carboxylase subunit epsilon n=1 Tax=Microbacterium luticocti TaxID=451764 RepID=UPI000402746F|nr:acyl-CoA carboxylase subunit epsilon [Microbacterium luticocti]